MIEYDMMALIPSISEYCEEHFCNICKYNLPNAHCVFAGSLEEMQEYRQSIGPYIEFRSLCTKQKCKQCIFAIEGVDCLFKREFPSDWLDYIDKMIEEEQKISG